MAIYGSYVRRDGMSFGSEEGRDMTNYLRREIGRTSTDASVLVAAHNSPNKSYLTVSSAGPDQHLLSIHQRMVRAGYVTMENIAAERSGNVQVSGTVMDNWTGLWR